MIYGWLGIGAESRVVGTVWNGYIATGMTRYFRFVSSVREHRSIQCKLIIVLAVRYKGDPMEDLHDNRHLGLQQKSVGKLERVLSFDVF